MTEVSSHCTGCCAVLAIANRSAIAFAVGRCDSLQIRSWSEKKERRRRKKKQKI